MMARLRRIAWAFLAVALALPASAAPAIPTFTTLDGKKLGPAALSGKLVLVNFWATSCGICLAEMPDLAATYSRYQSRSFEVIAVAMRYDQADRIRAYAAKQRLPFPVVFDRNGALAREFGGVDATPTSFLIDRSGKRISKTVGIIDFDRLQAFLESASAP